MFKEGLEAIKLTKKFAEFKNSDNEESKRVAAKYINNILDNEKGLFLKIGQVLGSKPEAMDEFKDLTKSRSSAIELKIILPYLEELLGRPHGEIFSEIEESKYPASIGQVHKAKLITGQDVAIKIQYPNIKEKINSQLKLLKLIPVASVFADQEVGHGLKSIL